MASDVEMLLKAAETSETEGLHSSAEFFLAKALEHPEILQGPLHTQTLSVILGS
jgi:hypothetical protein